MAQAHEGSCADADGGTIAQATAKNKSKDM